MTKTTTELADAVLRELGVVDAEETPDSVDRTYVTDRYSEKFAALSAPGLEVTYWAEDEIPDAIFLTLRDLIMNEVRGAFGDPVDPNEKEAREASLLRPLRRHISREASGLPAQAQSDYF
jgi:hypothetical protein